MFNTGGTGLARIKHFSTTPKYGNSIPNPTTNNNNLNPWFVTGFSDAEACFSIKVTKNKKMALGWRIQAVFSIGLHAKDLVLLKQIQSFFNGIGAISSIKSNGSVTYAITKIEDINDVLIPHFDKYPLISQKKADFLLFKSIVNLTINKSHLSLTGLEKIVGLKASLNRGLSEDLKAAFPNIIPVARPEVEFNTINPYWLAGFVSGEGSFYVSVTKYSAYKTGFHVRLRFTITQHIRDANLIKSLIKYLDCGLYQQPIGNRDTVEFVVNSNSSHVEKIIPFFHKYPIIGVKSLDFSDFCKVADIIKLKGHTTKSGLEQIIAIKGMMNTKREV